LLESKERLVGEEAPAQEEKRKVRIDTGKPVVAGLIEEHLHIALHSTLRECRPGTHRGSDSLQFGAPPPSIKKIQKGSTECPVVMRDQLMKGKKYSEIIFACKRIYYRGRIQAVYNVYIIQPER